MNVSDIKNKERLNNFLGNEEKIVFFKKFDDKFLIDDYYSPVGITKNNHLKCKDRYNKKYYIPLEFLNTVSEMWQSTINKPKYFIRVLPNSF